MGLVMAPDAANHNQHYFGISVAVEDDMYVVGAHKDDDLDFDTGEILYLTYFLDIISCIDISHIYRCCLLHEYHNNSHSNAIFASFFTAYNSSNFFTFNF
jgi:hypothetical protein